MLLHTPSFRSAALLIVAAAALLPACAPKSELDPDVSEPLIQPVARFEFHKAAPEAPPPGSRTGEEIYARVCTVCHATGTLDSPRTGDSAAWAPRIETGFDALVQSVISGKNNMPPRAGASDLTDTEVQRAVAYLANQAGAGFTEPQ
ncbi:hypothetical protein FACS1894116_07620 [Betaproteobacteria bacterium]|nr:hypothetical protein FACS1894116_07620 [Betaproteobacteria bacterium]GHU00082.1 hypothetical protein FACS1894154_08530 [Betaproteobacteria bacterium]